jgi:hypothetical protein
VDGSALTIFTSGLLSPVRRRVARYAGVMSDPGGGGWCALALNVAVQHSGDPLQDLVGEPGIIDGASQRDRTDQRRQDERGIVRFAGWRQAGEQVEVAADLCGVCGPGSLAAAGDVRG